MAGRKNQQLIVPESVHSPSGLKADGTPNVYWLHFKEKLENFQNVPLEQWKDEEILGYLLKRYRDHYNIDFSLSFSGPPTKCPEMYCIRRIKQVFNNDKAWILKEYIDWVFDSIIIPQKTKLESLAFFFSSKLCNKFKSIFRTKNKITRSTELPTNLLSEAVNLQLNLRTYGDLAFIRIAMDDKERDDFSVYQQLFQRLNGLGFDDSILMTLED